MDDFGGKLRQARERRGISLRQIAASTKISASALEALERNDVSKLPGGIFSRAFVRSYAVEVGLDPDETVHEFLERFDKELPPPAETVAVAIPEHERTYQEEQRKAVRTLAIIGATVLVVVVVGVFTLRARARQKMAIARPETASAPAEAASIPQPPAGATQSQPVESARPSPDAAVADAGLKLDLHPTADCWVSLTVDGQKLFARVMKSGEHESHAVQREAIVEIGDASVFAFSVNGRPGKTLGEAGQVKTLKLTPSTADQYLR
ncbi:MAG TPA: RodZ domain-containing protein [Vicinamibacterales bacterium]